MNHLTNTSHIDRISGQNTAFNSRTANESEGRDDRGRSVKWMTGVRKGEGTEEGDGVRMR